MPLKVDNKFWFISLMECVVGLAALFHDFGKCAKSFQSELTRKRNKGQALRHEWISVLFLTAYIDNESDKEWLHRLSNKEFDNEKLKSLVAGNKKNPFKGLGVAGGLIAWLVVTHHKLPICSNKNNKWHGCPSIDYLVTLGWLESNWGFEGALNNAAYCEALEDCFVYGHGIVSDSNIWRDAVAEHATKLIKLLPELEQCYRTNLLWPLSLYARTSLILGDHLYSSLSNNSSQRLRIEDLNLFANSNSKDNTVRQGLVEHLCGVERQAVRNINKLPFLNEPDKSWYTYNTTSPSIKPRRWQNNAATKIRYWVKENVQINERGNFGFFAINMASTGTGKTIANANIMKELSVDGECLRYILAVGLRVLTQQTANEYKNIMGLNKNDFAMLVGGSKEHLSMGDSDGSESSHPLEIGELFAGMENKIAGLDTVLKTKKDKQLLYTPVLCCTIDHIMSAVTCKRHGGFILSTLRLLSSDLVIDEIDNFSTDDLKAIGRLIHLAGMLGRKVMISSATTTPDIAEGYFDAYSSGYKIYAKLHNVSAQIGCAWVDEYVTVVDNYKSSPSVTFSQLHDLYINQRVGNLGKEVAKRKIRVIACDNGMSRLDYYNLMKLAVIENHHHHHVIDKISGKKISIGLVRFANVNPCIEFTKYLLNGDDEIEINVMAYHSQQLMVLRSFQEAYLDDVLNRKNGKSPLTNKLVRNRIKQSKCENIIFIVAATPIAEIGRDHDYDWAVIEPSSYYSIIQLVGRVLRHRDCYSKSKIIDEPNISIMQLNIRGLEGHKYPYSSPGPESIKYQLNEHSFDRIVGRELIVNGIDASARIKKNKLIKNNFLIELEHIILKEELNSPINKGPESFTGSYKGYWWLTGMSQQYSNFRASQPTKKWYYVDDADGGFSSDGTNEKLIMNKFGIKNYDLSKNEISRLWIIKDFEMLLSEQVNLMGERVIKSCSEINVSYYNNKGYSYNHQLGMYRGMLPKF